MSVWLDTDPLEADWRSPHRGLRIGRLLLAVLLVLALLAGVLWATGGFKERTDERIFVDPGVVFETGPFQFSFDHARIWEVKYTDQPREKWKVRVYGFGRTTGDRSRALPSGDSAIGRLGSGVADDATVSAVGQYRDFGAEFQPGMAMIAVELEAELPPEFEPGDTIDLAVSNLEFENRSNSGADTGLVLRGGGQYYVLTLPLTRMTGDIPR